MGKKKDHHDAPVETEQKPQDEALEG